MLGCGLSQLQQTSLSKDGLPTKLRSQLLTRTRQRYTSIRFLKMSVYRSRRSPKSESEKLQERTLSYQHIFQRLKQVRVRLRSLWCWSTKLVAYTTRHIQFLTENATLGKERWVLGRRTTTLTSPIAEFALCSCGFLAHPL